MLVRSGIVLIKYWFSITDEELERTHIPEARWWIVEGINKKKARLNCIHHLLQQIPYQEVGHDTIVLPERARQPDYAREPVPEEMHVPAVY
jgi:polyphosphate kinase 2 (PPK2 family)